MRREWRSGESPNPRSIDAHIKSVRRQLGDFGHAIETVRGIGYRFTKKAGHQRRTGDFEGQPVPKESISNR